MHQRSALLHLSVGQACAMVIQATGVHRVKNQYAFKANTKYEVRKCNKHEVPYPTQHLQTVT